MWVVQPENWKQLLGMQFPSRAGACLTSFSAKLWLLGGYTVSDTGVTTTLKDVWLSGGPSDGGWLSLAYFPSPHFLPLPPPPAPLPPRSPAGRPVPPPFLPPPSRLSCGSAPLEVQNVPIVVSVRLRGRCARVAPPPPALCRAEGWYLIDSNAPWHSRAHLGCQAFAGALVVFGGISKSTSAFAGHTEDAGLRALAPSVSYLDDIWSSEDNSYGCSHSPIPHSHPFLHSHHPTPHPLLPL
jgi:hypothetical protein